MRAGSPNQISLRSGVLWAGVSTAAVILNSGVSRNGRTRRTWPAPP